MAAEAQLTGMDSGVIAATALASAAAVAEAPRIRSSKDRLRAVEDHLKFHPGRKAVVKAPAPSSSSSTAVAVRQPDAEEKDAPAKLGLLAAAAAAAGTATRLIPSGFVSGPTKAAQATVASPLVSRGVRWVAPPLLVVVSIVAAFKHRHTRERIFNLLMQGGLWALKQQFVATQHPAAQEFLAQAELSTCHAMQEFTAGLRQLLPLEAHFEQLQRKGELTRDSIVSIWFDLEVCALTRIAVGVVVLGVSHFISSALHALTPASVGGGLFTAATEVLDLPLQLDLDALVRAATKACRNALQERKLEKLSSKGSYTQLEEVLRETRSAVEEELGVRRGSHVVLHEALLGEERAAPLDDSAVQMVSASEHDLLKKLRDLLESPGPCRLLRSTLDTFCGVACSHLNTAFKASLVDMNGVASAAEPEVPMRKFFPRLKNELVKISEDRNEYLLSLTGGDDDRVETPWSSFFLDLNSLEAPAPPAGARMPAADQQLEGLLSTLASA